MKSAFRKKSPPPKREAPQTSAFQPLLAVEAALARILPMTQPADAELNSFFRANPKLGKQDRQYIAATVCGILRRRISLAWHTQATTARQLIIAYLNRTQGMSLRQLEPLIGTDDVEWAANFKARAGEAVPLYVMAELPEWLVNVLRHDMSEDDILALGRALQQQAPLDLRVNALAAKRDEVVRKLATEGMQASATPYSPLGVRVANNPSLGTHPLFVHGEIEIQDEGSQLLAYLVAPKRREMVADFCAGAGGKTLALGALMQSQGRLYAFDVSETRLNKLKPRLKRSGLSNVNPQLIASENDLKIKRLAGKFDRVLVDAPCSGFGTLRRNPDLKWRQSETSIGELTAKQQRILTAAAALVKPGGRLVYATCSFLRAENQDVIAAFLAAHAGFKLVPARDVLAQAGIPLDTGDYLQLYPHVHGCDGFFAAVLERTQ